MRLAYVVSRFPVDSETFVLSELNALENGESAEITLLSLFSPERPFAHAEAERWLGRVRRPARLAATFALAYWLRRKPVTTVRMFADVVVAYRGSPALLARALVTLPIACAHARTLRAERLGHVHAHFATYPALTAWACRRLTGVTYGFTAHAHDIYVHQDHLREVIAEAEYVVTVSDFNRRFLAEYGGDQLTPVHVVRCGVDLARYPFVARAPVEGRRPRALCVASLQTHKGHRVLLQALALRLPGTETLDLLLVGDGPMRGELETLSAGLGLADRVRFLGTRDQSEVGELLAQADVFVLPSIVAADGQMEGVPVALMEALAAGVPTVATRLSGVPELVRDGETGLLAEPGDPADLAAMLALTLAEPQAAAARAHAGRALVERDYEISRSAGSLARLFIATTSV